MLVCEGVLFLVMKLTEHLCVLGKGEVFSDWLETSGMHEDDLL